LFSSVFQGAPSMREDRGGQWTELLLGDHDATTIPLIRSGSNCARCLSGLRNYLTV
jgi:hypothetical protein